MPFNTPTLTDVRKQVRDHVAAYLPGANALIPNSLVRVLSEAKAGLAHSVHLHLGWISRQVLVDTCDEDWLVRHGEIWDLPRKAAILAEGTVLVEGNAGLQVPAATRFFSTNEIEYEATETVVLSSEPVNLAVRALDPGAAGNKVLNETLQFSAALPGINASAKVVEISGGADDEPLEDWRERILARIQEPPHGGALHDYIAWGLEVPGCTRVFPAAQEMGIGTMTVRPLFDELRAEDDGFPTADDLDAVRVHLDAVRPVTVRDLFVVAPVKKEVHLTITRLENDTPATRAAIEEEIRLMLRRRAAPAATIYRSWVAEAISTAAGEDSHDLDFSNMVCGTGEMAVFGSVTYSG